LQHNVLQALRFDTAAGLERAKGTRHGRDGQTEMSGNSFAASPPDFS
jgi:hypothetical protein